MASNRAITVSGSISTPHDLRLKYRNCRPSPGGLRFRPGRPFLMRMHRLPSGELSRTLPRAFEYYGGSVPMQVGQSRLFRASRSYTDRRYDAVRCPVHPLNPSTRGAPDGLRSKGPRHETLAIVRNWRVSRFRQNRYIDRCRLGFKQYSLHRARLALTGIAPLRLGRIRPYSKHAIVPRPFPDFRSFGPEVSLVGRGFLNLPHHC